MHALCFFLKPHVVVFRYLTDSEELLPLSHIPSAAGGALVPKLREALVSLKALAQLNDVVRGAVPLAARLLWDFVRGRWRGGGSSHGWHPKVVCGTSHEGDWGGGPRTFGTPSCLYASLLDEMHGSVPPMRELRMRMSVCES